MTIGIGIVGTGRMGQAHTEALLKIPAVKKIAITSSSPEKGRQFAQKYGIISHDDYQALLNDADIQAIVICTPHTLHYDFVVSAANAGKHILCEKPIETTHEKMNKMIEICAKNKVIFMPGHTHRFLPANIKVKQLIEEGRIGQPIMVHDRLLSLGFQQDYPAWLGNRSLAGGGDLILNGVHSVDRMRYWLNAEVLNVFARCGRYVLDIEVEDNGMMFLTMSNGTYATSEISWSTPKPAEACIAEIIGTDGVIEVNTWGKPIRVVTKSDDSWREIPIPDGDGYINELMEFVSAIQENRTPSVTPEDGRAAVSAILAAYESDGTGKAITPL